MNQVSVEKGPKWEGVASVRGVTLHMVSPLDLTVDLPLVPVPGQAEIDRLSGHRPGVLVRLWRWLFGAPRVRASDLPADGGAAHVRGLCLAMYGQHHAEFLATLTTGELYSLTQMYMGYQVRWSQALYDYGVAQAESQFGASAAGAAGGAGGTGGASGQGDALHAAVFGPFGPPANRYGTGIVGFGQQGTPASNHTSNGSAR